MKAWKTSALGEVVTIAGGGTPTRSNPDFYGGTIPWVTPKDMKSWEITGAQITITQSGLDNSAARLVPRNSILIVVRSGVLKHTIPVGLNRLPVAINQDMKALQCRDGIDADFLARFIKAQSPVILQWVRATTADNFPIDKLKKLSLPLPPLAEQRRIAEVLDRAEALRAKRRAALAQLDSLTQSLFLDLFGDSRRNSKHPQSVLDECAEVVSGIAKGRKLDGKQKLIAPYLRVANVQAGFLDLSEIKTIEALPSELLELSLKPGDVVLTEGGDHDKLGRGAMWEGQIEGCIHQNHVFRVRPNQAHLLPRFFHEFLQTPAARGYFLRCAKRTTNLASINMSQLRALPVPLPPLALQREFARRVSAVEKLKTAQRASLAELDALFATLQHRAFRGEL